MHAYVCVGVCVSVCVCVCVCLCLCVIVCLYFIRLYKNPYCTVQQYYHAVKPAFVRD